MASMSAIRERADQLRLLPKMTPARLLVHLRREFRWAEKDQLINAARVPGYQTGVTPGWGKLHPVISRWQPKGRPEIPVIKSERQVIAVNYPLITIEAKHLRQGDWVEGIGHVERLGNYSTMVLVWLPNGEHTFLWPRDRVDIRLEDHGQRTE